MNEVNEKIIKILQALKREKELDTFQIAKITGLQLNETEKFLGFLLSQGYVTAHVSTLSCTQCLLKDVCSASRKQKIMFYIITEKGEKFLKERG